MSQWEEQEGGPRQSVAPSHHTRAPGAAARAASERDGNPQRPYPPEHRLQCKR